MAFAGEVLDRALHAYLDEVLVYGGRKIRDAYIDILIASLEGIRREGDDKRA